MNSIISFQNFINMPTVVLLDVSLSMFRPVQSTENHENQTRISLAASALSTFFDYLSIHAKLEYVSLVTFSSVYEVTVPFTRDFDIIKSKLNHLEEGDKTCLETALHGINQHVLSEWGHQTPVQVIIITDGNFSVGPIGQKRIIQLLPLPLSFPAKIHILPIASSQEACLQLAMPIYQKVVDMSSNLASSICNTIISRGAIYCPDQLSTSSVNNAVGRLCEQQYQEFWCWLKCGQLEARVQLFPAPQPVLAEGAVQPSTISQQIHIIGFISQQDLGTPIAVSKHLIIPQSQSNSNGTLRDNYSFKTPTKEGANSESSAAEEDTADPSKIPNFCVLLHGALKVEGMAAIVQLGSEWWGCVSAWCEAQRSRRSCLVLSALRPGPSSAPWLGPLDQLGPPEDATTPNESFPVRSWRSYSGSGAGAGGAAWARPHALLADVQKVLRHARKLPDKTQHLYKELNRLRRAAISLGFTELLSVVGGALERECAALGGGEGALQLAHAAAALRDPRNALDPNFTLHPLAPSFTITATPHQ